MMDKEIEKVYFGKADCCCCGCAGKYHTSKAMVTKAKKRIDAALINPSSVDDIFHHYDEFSNIVSIQSGGRMTTIYYK